MAKSHDSPSFGRNAAAMTDSFVEAKYSKSRQLRGSCRSLSGVEPSHEDGISASIAARRSRSPARRELVAYLPPDGETKLLETIRHEAFHQYLSYAALFRSVSPWLNEGYAQYFENTSHCDWHPTPEAVKTYAEALVAVMLMDYDEFYAGSDEARALKYRLAWSIAYFLETGAKEVRFQPFEDVRRRYLVKLLQTGDMREATAYAFESRDKLADFVEEWSRFWKGK